MMRGSALKCRTRSTIRVPASRTKRSKRASPSGELRRCARCDRQRCVLACPEQANVSCLANGRALARSGRARAPVTPLNSAGDERKGWSLSLSQQRLLVRLHLQFRRKVCNYGDGLADLLRNSIEKDFL